MPDRTRKVKITQSLAANKTQGWRVLRIWEHELARRNEARLMKRMRMVIGD